MDREAKKVQPEREKTDESLRSERKNTDQAMADIEASASAADAVVERARDQADAVLDTARDKADLKVTPGVAAAIANERAREDAALQRERALADESLRLRRDQEARKLAALLPLEREKTDRHLLTERTRSDDALANRDDFMGMVSHDLRNLLAGIVLSADHVAQAAPPTEEGRQAVADVARIQRYVARMNRLIGDLVDVVSIDAGKLAITTEKCDAVGLVTEAVDAFSHAAEGRKITLATELVQPSMPAEFDRQRMLQVLANLITNALKFTPEGGKVTVRCALVDHELRLKVTDSGKGIATHLLETVFARFWQVTKNDQRGLGLGLYITRCIVDAHGGKIWADSKPGLGSVFHVTIPVKHDPIAS